MYRYSGKTLAQLQNYEYHLPLEEWERKWRTAVVVAASNPHARSAMFRMLTDTNNNTNNTNNNPGVFCANRHGTHKISNSSPPFTMMILSTWISCVFLVCVCVLFPSIAQLTACRAQLAGLNGFSVLFVCFFFVSSLRKMQRERVLAITQALKRARWRRGHCSLFTVRCCLAAHKLAKCACKWCNRPNTNNKTAWALLRLLNYMESAVHYIYI